MRWEQYEVWVLNGDKWEMVAAFRDFHVAQDVARARNARVRLIHALYENDKLIEHEILAEVGSTREHP